MKIALLHRMFALLLVAGLMLGPVAHAAFAGEHCAHVAAQETFGDRSSGEYDGARTSANPGDCENHSQLCSNCLPWADAAAHVPDAAPQDRFAAMAADWRHDQSRILQIHHANSARGPPLA